MSRGPRPHAGHRKRARRGSGRPQHRHNAPATVITWLPMAAGVFNGARDQAERDEFPVCPADHYAVVGLVDGLHGVTVHAFAPLPMSDARTVELVDELRPLMDEMLWERGL